MKKADGLPGCQVAGLPIKYIPPKSFKGDPQQHCPRPSLSNLTYGFLALMHHACSVECDKNMKKSALLEECEIDMSNLFFHFLHKELWSHLSKMII